MLPEFARGFAAQYYVGHGARVRRRGRGFTVDGGGGLRQRCPTCHAEQDRRYFAITIRPQVFINLVPDHVIVHRMFPLGRGPDDGGVRLAVRRRRWSASGQDVSRSVELFDRVNRQDFEACERTQPSMSSRAYATAACWSRASTTSPTSTPGCRARCPPGGAP